MKKKIDENLIQKLLNKIKRKKDDEEIVKLEKIKEKVKKVKTIEELELIEDELEEIGVLDREKLEKLKKKKKRELERQNQTFAERIRCDLETINRIIAVGRAYKKKERIREEKEILQAKEERDKNGGVRQKEKEKEKGERTRSGGGRSRDSR